MRVVGGVGLLLLVAIALAPRAATAQEVPPGVAPLFQDHGPLTIRIEADFKSLRGDRGDNEDQREGRLIVIEDDGTETTLPLKIRTRGKFRLQRSTCAFPPLRLSLIHISEPTRRH